GRPCRLRSGRVPGLAKVWSADLRALDAFSTDVTDLQGFWTSRIAYEPELAIGGRLLLDERAVVSVKDRFVRQGSGVGDLPERFVERLRVRHKNLVKPTDKESRSFRWRK
ncbi:hypothetical protein IH970_02595, partial [candidate division KSB1 bacterium]|nr:hypothetical protein [candidate division KSB1 bacterium]